jgi:hypoxanthine phosphoribosyltransferase
MTGIRCEALKVSLRDDDIGPESNCWMSEDAFGYNDGTIVSAGPLHKNILIVDDINDTGSTFNWIKQDWQASCLPDDTKWQNIWDQNVRFATLTENLASDFSQVRYTCHEINKAEEDVWLVYPWENVAEY